MSLSTSMPLDAAAGAAGVAQPSPAAVDLEALLAGDALRSAYQPLVRLRDGALVGYEALVRGPRGTTLERPDALFAAAREQGLLTELEWACRAAALRGALDAGLGDDLSLFVNLEPSTLGDPVPNRLRGLVDEAARRLNVVFELTERALTERPRDVLAAVPALRGRGFRIALDDVGADPRSVALMPFLRPDVIKLDMHLVQGGPSAATASVVHAVRAEVERTGALLLAEGIETEAHAHTARALGAGFGQGWAFGRPGPLPTTVPSTRVPVAHRTAPVAAEDRTAFDLVSEHAPIEEGPKGLLYSFSRSIEAQVTARSDSAVLLSTFQDARHFTADTRARYRRLGSAAAFVGVLGTGLSATSVPHVRGADIRADEPLHREWDVVLIDPHFAAAFVAQDLGDEDCDDWDRRFRFCTTYDRPLAVAAARTLMRRFTAVDAAGQAPPA